MSESTQIIQRAASFDWETLLPVIFFILYGVAQFFGAKKKGEAAEERDPEEDPMEKARQIREEIRRKIAERKQPSEKGRSSPHPSYDPTLPESQQTTPRQSSQNTRPVVVKQAQPVRTQGPTAGIEQKLIEQRKRLQEARQQHEAAMVQARKMTREASVKRQADSRKLYERKPVQLDSSSQLRDAVIAGLHHPNSLRKAVLYREILDPPIGLR